MKKIWKSGIAAVAGICVLFAGACGGRTETFLDALRAQEGVTKAEQTILIADGETVVYECTVRVTTGGGATSVETTTWELGLGEENFRETSETEYFSEGMRYFLREGVWTAEAGTYERSAGIDLTDGDLENAVIGERTLRADIRAEALGKITRSAEDIREASLELSLNEEDAPIILIIRYTAASGRTVEIRTDYAYGEQTVTLPAVA